MRTLIVLFILLIGTPLFAVTDYYVDIDSINGACSNAFNTTQAQVISTPWCTVQKCEENASTGVRCNVANGNHLDDNADKDVLIISESGTAGSNGLDKYGHQAYDEDTWITFKSTNKYGAKIDCDSNNSNRGILISTGDYILIDGFEVFDCKRAGTHVNNPSSNLRFVNMKYHDIGRIEDSIGNGRSAIFFGVDVSFVTIDKSIFFDIGRLNSFTTPPADDSTCGTKCFAHDHGIYTTADNAVINNSLFYGDINSGWPIQVRQSASNTYVVNNTLIGPHSNRPGNMVLDDDMDGFWLENNIFFQQNTSAIHAFNGIKTNGFIRNNLTDSDTLVSNSAGAPLPDDPGGSNTWTYADNQLSTTPVFADIGNDDYHLVAGSTNSIDKGLNTNCPVDDFDDNPRPINGGTSLTCDIGAYEYTGSADPSFVTVGHSDTGIVCSGTSDIIIQSVESNCSVTYSLFDNVGDSLAKCYYDLDNDKTGGTPMLGQCAAAAEGTDATCAWDTDGVAENDYYVYCEVIGDETVNNVSVNTITILADIDKGGTNATHNATIN